jgi:hypothetical protein
MTDRHQSEQVAGFSPERLAYILGIRTLAIPSAAKRAALMGEPCADFISAAACVTPKCRRKPCAADADIVLILEDRHRDLDMWLVAVARCGRSRRAAPASTRPGHPPPLMVSFSAWVSRARRGSLAVAQ